MIPLMFLDLQDYNQTWLGNRHQWAGKWKPRAINAGLSIAMLPLPNQTDRTFPPAAHIARNTGHRRHISGAGRTVKFKEMDIPR